MFEENSREYQEMLNRAQNNYVRDNWKQLGYSKPPPPFEVFEATIRNLEKVSPASVQFYLRSL